LLASTFYSYVSAYDSRAGLTTGAPDVLCFPSHWQLWSLLLLSYRVPYAGTAQLVQSYCSAHAQQDEQ